MAKIPTTPQAAEFNIRPGVAPLADVGWGGVNTEDDPSSLGANELQRGQNLRRHGRALRSRPGLVQKIDLTTIAGFNPGSVLWIREAPVVCSPLNLWASAIGVYGGTPTTGASILQLESVAAPIANVYGTITATADRQIPLASYGTKIAMGDGGILRELVRILVFPTSTLNLSSDLNLRIPSLPTVALAQAPAGHVIRCLLEFDGKLFVGLENVGTPASSKIMVWDGVELVDDITGIRPPLAFGIWRNKLVAGFDATAAHIRVRDVGAAPGSWTTVALAGFLCATQGNAMVEVGPYLYIASGTNLIHRYDGSSLSLVRTIGTCAVDGNGCTSLVLHRGLLYYGWNVTATYNAVLGRHDPSSSASEWIDTYKDLTADVANFKRVSALASYRGRIYCGGWQRWVVATFPDYVRGAVQAIYDTGAPASGFGIIQFLRA